MAYTLEIGIRYLRSKKRKTISVITFIAVAGVALGVAALLAVLAITTGFQKEFRDKVLGVNAHVLVMKYGVDFDEYRDVMQRAEEMPEVAGVGPFLIIEMMMAKDDRLSGVLVKGIDPERMPQVLDLPSQLIDGSLRGLRVEGARPALHPDDITNTDPEENWDWLEDFTQGEGDAATDEEMENLDVEAVLEHLGDQEGILQEDGSIRPALRRTPVWEQNHAEGETDTPRREGADLDFEPLPEVQVASPEDVEQMLQDLDDDDDGLDDEWNEQWFAEEEERARRDADGIDRLPGIVIGATLAREMGVGVGDRVRLVSPLSGLDVSMLAPEARTPKSRDFRVTGIFQAGFQEYDSRLVYTDLYEAQQFYGHGDSVVGVEMKLHDLEQSREVARRLERELGGPFHTLDWAELNRNLFTALEIQKIVLGFVIAMIIVVAALNVIATLIMIVLEKKREIAILKAMGAGDGTVLGIFVLQGMVIGVIGTIVGLVIGGGIVAYLGIFEFPLDPKVYLIDHLPVVVNGIEFVITALVALAICALATIAPSFWAAKMLPVEGLRHE
ncbi:MAG: ABC transporter permease [Myxococcota bacterium]